MEQDEQGICVSELSRLLLICPVPFVASAVCAGWHDTYRHTTEVHHHLHAILCTEKASG